MQSDANKGMAPPKKARMSPAQQSATRQTSMSRADSLASIQKYGRIVRPGQAVPAASQKKPKGGNPVTALIKALTGGGMNKGNANP